MPRFLSPEWLDALARAGRDAEMPGLAGRPPLIIEQTVAGGPGGEVTYHLVIAAAAITVADGPSPDAQVRFSADYDTASAIARGSASAAEAFLGGRLRIGGDARALLAAGEALAGLDDVFAAVRAETTY